VRSRVKTSGTLAKNCFCLRSRGMRSPGPSAHQINALIQERPEVPSGRLSRFEREPVIYSSIVRRNKPPERLDVGNHARKGEIESRTKWVLRYGRLLYSPAPSLGVLGAVSWRLLGTQAKKREG
jgi:hypothetical protein